MSIAAHVDWGEPARLPSDLRWFAHDAAAAAYLAALRRSGELLPPIGLSGGDLFRTIGGRAGSPCPFSAREGSAWSARKGSASSPQSTAAGSTAADSTAADSTAASHKHRRAGVRFSVDLGAVLLDGRLHWFLAHCVSRGSWLRGRVVVAANAAFIGDWNVAPRAHPGDGRLDLLDADLSLGERLRARRRLPAGTHVPHPDIVERSVRAAQMELDSATPVFLDGVRVARCSRLSLRTEHEAVEVWIRARGQQQPAA